MIPSSNYFNGVFVPDSSRCLNHDHGTCRGSGSGSLCLMISASCCFPAFNIMVKLFISPPSLLESLSHLWSDDVKVLLMRDLHPQQHSVTLGVAQQQHLLLRCSQLSLAAQRRNHSNGGVCSVTSGTTSKCVQANVPFFDRAPILKLGSTPTLVMP